MNSLRRRVAVVVAAGAAIAATIAASTASVVAALALRAVEDRRLNDAALVFAAELDRDLVVVTDEAAIARIVADEAVEMHHTGIVFALDVAGRGAGDPRLPAAGPAGCHDIVDLQLRLCRVTTPRGFVVVAADAHTDPTSLFILAACAAALIAALLGVVVSQPLAAFVVAPLSRLRERLAAINVDSAADIDLGESEGIVEVDDVRATALALLHQTREALDHARRFAADAAHELRTPLAAIGAELELLAEQAHPDTADIVRVQGLSARLQRLVERLLILATPGGLVATEVVDMRDILEDVVATVAANDRARVILNVVDGAVVRGDPVLLGTLFGNGIGNALQHAAHVVVDVRCSDEQVIVVVHDDGPGIAVADRRSVFAPFVQTAEGRQRRRGGHGLGLALVAHIAQLHGGAASFVDGDVGAHLQIVVPRAR